MEFLHIRAIKGMFFRVEAEAELPDQVLPMPPDFLSTA